MQRWMTAAVLAACWPLLGSAGGAAATRLLNLPPVFLTPLVFAAASLAGYVILWAYFVDPLAGRITWALLVVGNLAWLSGRVRHLWPRRAEIPRDAWTPFALTVLITIACLAYLEGPGVSAPYRFTIPLPVADHLAPQLLADRFAAGIRSQTRPLAPLTTFGLVTQTSDRPPLQAGVALIARPPWRASAAILDTAYQAAGTLCQVAVLPSLLALAAALGLSRREMLFALVGVAGSGFFLLNAVYPWPKLYASSLVLTGLALLVQVSRLPGRRAAIGLVWSGLVLVWVWP